MESIGTTIAPHPLAYSDPTVFLIHLQKSSGWITTPNTLPRVAATIPGVAIIFVALGYVINLTRAYHPRWSRNFIREFPSPSGKKSANSQRHLSRWVIGLLLLSLIGLGLQITSSFLELRSLEYISSPLSWAISCLIIIVTRIRTASIPLLVLFVSLFISNLGAIIYTNSPLRYTTIPVALSAVLALFGVLAVLCMPLRDPALQDDSIAPVYDSPGSDLSSPEDNLTPWQYMSVSWMAPLISLGTKRQLQGDDVWDLPYEFKHRRLHDKFRDLDGSVLKRLLVANALDLLITTALGIVEMIANLSGPVLLQLLLQAMEDTGSSKKLALTWATISLLVRLVACQSAVFSTWYSRRSYERSRGEMITMLYEKTLNRKIFAGRKRDPTRSDNNEETEDGQGESDGPGNPFTRTWKQLQLYLSKCCKARKKEKPRDESEDFASMGKILNLMRNDVYEVSQRFWEFQNLITQPLSLILSIILIWRLIGWSCLLGMVIVLASQAANALTARALTRWERVRRSATDSKLQKISQFVMAIRHLRWYGWQESWLSNIMDARQHELNLRIVTGLLNVLVGFTTMLSSNLFPVLAFFAYTALAGRPLRIDVAFPAIDLFQMLSINLRLLPGLITTLVNASVALGRIQRFMREPDRPHEEHLGDEVSTLQLNKASFAWPGVDAEVLHDVTLSFPRGLTVVYGEVASGKTALLQALLGELDRRSGELLSPPEMIGYCAQTPWLESMSIRENILFFAAYDHARYRQVLEDCALVADMANFSHGDLSNIGENGIGLSGGQKARVALARAVYSRAKILILDDPFSALDHQTAETIVRRCFGRPLMEDRTIILATHRTELFQGLSKQWVEVADGKARVVESDYTALHSLPKTTSAASGDHDAEMQAEEETAEIPERFIEDEHRAHGDVQARVYWEYIKSGQLKWWGVSISFLAFYKLLDVAQAWFLKQWGEAYDSSDAQTISGPFDRFPAPDVNLKPWLLGFLLLAIAMSVAYLIDQLMHLVIIYSAGKRMFRDVMYHVSGATFRFYDVTPVGRLMNRLTSDINTIDGNISILFQLVAFYSITWISSIIVFASATPVFLIFALALTAAFVLIFLRFLPTSQSLRRLEMVSLSPLMSNFGALVEGLTTVRAFRVQYQFQERVIAVTDTFQKMDHFYWSLQAWLTYRFDALSACSTFALTMLALFTRVSPGLTAFVLVAASRFVTATHGLCRYYGQLQMDFVSVERVVEMLHLEQEPKGDVQPPAWWPSLSGDIVFEDVTMRYAPHMDPALSQLSLRIPGGSNTAVIGRTGSGKSTLALSLLGTIIPDMGRILIDNQDISTIDRQTLRKRITFLAQEPVLFEGTMRQNLDPLSEYSDFECTDAIRKVADRHNWTLTTPVDAGGRSFSQGQRQLVGLARALLRRSAIVILDEATASIDRETAMQIQRVLREDMNGSTVITIAHRLEAVEKADYCVVLGKGKLVKMGTPESMKEESLNDLLR